MIKIRHIENAIPVGYAKLIEMFAIQELPHYRSSFILRQGSPFLERENHQETHYYTPKYFPKDLQDPIHHLEFALKRDGINLVILLAVFNQLNPKLLETYILSQPTSGVARKIWFLYEFLTGNTLNLNNAAGGSYIPLLDPKEYYTANGVRSRRHYIYNNLLGNRSFCPVLRRTQKLKQFEDKNLSDIANKLMQQYDPATITRAVNYLYVKETMSSYEIEREKPNSSRTHRFVEALKQADHIGTLNKAILIDLQNVIIDPRFANKDYREFQNYIGTEPRLDLPSSLIIYIPPKPEDVTEMMQGLLDSLENMLKSNVHPVIVAAAIAFGFVFIHPFEDGNGRIHRFMMHYIFARAAFVPKGAIFPVSAVILKQIASYDTLLESFSKPLLNLIKDYTLDHDGKLTVNESTSNHYRFLDYTHFAEYLFDCVEKTIYTDFKKELNYIKSYDKIKRALQKIVDMPDKQLNLFIQLVIQNNGTLSSKKRETFFSMLTDDEVHQLEKIIQTNTTS